MSTAADRQAHLAPPASREGWLRLTPLDRRRLDNFKANTRGFWSFWLFLTLFVMSLGSEFLANDRPILAYYKGELLVPAFVSYPEEKFGGFLARTDYRDPIIAKEIKAHGWMLWPPIRYSYDTHNLELADARALAADLDADASSNARPPRRRNLRRASPIADAPPSNGTGSAPTIRAATSSRACSMAFAFRCCSD